MTRFALAFAAVAALAATGPARAVEIFEAKGAWQGEGRLATGAKDPLQRGRCRVEIDPQPGGRDVSVVGKCVVAAGASDISLRVVRSGSGKVNAGFWSAATQQTVQYSGSETGSAIRLVSTTPLTVDAQDYESMVEVDAPDPESFTIRQMLRAPGAEAWRLVVDMTYRQAGG